MFSNRLEENGGVLGFRDVTGAVFPPNYVTGQGHYEQEMGDLDGDGDLDILGLNWKQTVGFHDATYRNVGDGTFEQQGILPGSGSDDNEGDFIDYDNDGDLDIFIANWSGVDRLYRNISNASALTFVEATLPAANVVSLDGECCDVDGDGDCDLFVSANNHQPNVFYENTTQVPDTTAPYLPNVEQAPSRAPSSDPTVVRAHVYDNAPYYITWYNTTTLTYTVNGLNPVTVPAQSSGGQIFRAEIPGLLMGLVEYSFTSEDEYGNAGSSATFSYASVFGGINTGAPHCFGDGTGAACGCGFGAIGAGCRNSTGGGAVLTAFGHGSFATDSFGLTVEGAPGSTPGLVLRGTNMIANSVGEGILCTSAGIKRSQVVVTSSLGTTTLMDFKGAPFGNVAIVNAPTNFQFYYRDNAGACLGAGFNFSNAWTLTYVP